VEPASPVDFPLRVRIPAWAENTTIAVNGSPISGVRNGTYQVINRRWIKGDSVEIKFPMLPRVSRWENNSVAIERGPLVFSLKIGESWSKLQDDALAPDWEVSATTPWNYGLLVDPAHVATTVKVVESAIGEYPFSAVSAPVQILMKARRVAEWQLVDGSAGPLPQSPVKSQSPEEQVTLIPYGSAKLRITAFPQVAQGASSEVSKSSEKQ
jgi:hypothetical protein